MTPADPLAEAVERLLAFVEGVHGARLVGADLRLVLSALASRDAEASAMRAVVEAAKAWRDLDATRALRTDDEFIEVYEMLADAVDAYLAAGPLGPEKGRSE